MVNKTGKTAQPVWINKGQTAKIGSTPKPANNLNKLGNAYAKINANPGLIDKVGNGRIEHDDNGMPKGVAGRGSTLSKGSATKASFNKRNSPRGC